jgi:hypothetical protein
LGYRYDTHSPAFVPRQERKVPYMRGLFRVAIALVLLVSALTAASAAPAANGEWSHSSSGRTATKATGKVPASVKRALRAQAGRTAGEAKIASAVGPLQLGPGEYAGFAYCGNEIAWIWPADAPGHDVTVTRTYVVSSASGNFDDYVVDPSPYYVIQIGTDYYIYDIDLGQVIYGPTNYADAWVELSLLGNTDSVLFVNEITFIDGGVASAPEFVWVEALGPTELGASNVCQP